MLRRLAALGLLTAASCNGPAGPQDAALPGVAFDLVEYILADSSHFALADLCLTLADPPNLNSTALASASLQFSDTSLREQQVRLEHFACSGSLTGDTVLIDQQRLYAVQGTQVRVRRPNSTGGWYEDTGYVRRDTLDMVVHQCADLPCATVLWRYIQRP